MFLAVKIFSLFLKIFLRNINPTNWEPMGSKFQVIGAQGDGQCVKQNYEL
jgi:hypothetical protein